MNVRIHIYDLVPLYSTVEIYMRNRYTRAFRLSETARLISREEYIIGTHCTMGAPRALSCLVYLQGVATGCFIMLLSSCINIQFDTSTNTLKLWYYEYTY